MSKTKRKDKSYYPEQLAAAAELGLDPENDTLLMKLAHDMCRPESLSKDWSAEYDCEQKKRKYLNRATGEVKWVHPLLGYYKGAIYMERGGYQRLLEKDTAQPPTEEAIYLMGEYLGIRPEEHSYVLEVARMAISASLPPEWIELVDRENRVSYKNIETEEVSNLHPLDSYFIELRNRRRKEARSRRNTRTTSIGESPRDVHETEDTLKALLDGARERPRTRNKEGNNEIEIKTENKTVQEDESFRWKMCTVLEWFSSEASKDDYTWHLCDKRLQMKTDLDKLPMEMLQQEIDILNRGISFDHVAQDASSWQHFVCSELDAIWGSPRSQSASNNSTSLGLTILSVNALGSPSARDAMEKVAQLLEHISKEKSEKINTRIAILSTRESTVFDLLGNKSIVASKDSIRSSIQWKEISGMKELLDIAASTEGSHPQEFKDSDFLIMAEIGGTGSQASKIVLSFIHVEANLEDKEARHSDIELILLDLCKLRYSQPTQSSDKTALLLLVGETGLMLHPTLMLNFAYTPSSLANMTTLKQLSYVPKLMDSFRLCQDEAREQVAEILELTLRRLQQQKRLHTHQLEDLKGQLQLIQKHIGRLLEAHDLVVMGQDDVVTVEKSVEGLEQLLKLRREHLSRVQNIQTEAMELRKQISVLESQNGELEAHINSLTSEVESHDHDIEAKETNLRRLHDEINQLKNETKSKDEQLSRCKTEVERLKFECGNVEEMRERIAWLESQIVELKGKSEALEQEKLHSEQGLEELRQKYNDLICNIKDLHEVELTQQQSFDQLQAELKSQTEISRQHEEASSEQEARIDALKSEIRRLQLAKKDIERQLENSKAHAEALKKSIHEVQDNNRRRLEYSQKLERGGQELNQKVEELTSLLESTEQNRQDLRKQLDQASAATSRMVILEQEKALLLDRFEGVTGKPMGDIYDEVPPMPVGFYTPRAEGVSKKVECTPEEALKSISRIARLAHPISETRRGSIEQENGDQNAWSCARMADSNGVKMSPADIVMVVRDLRSERNELRRRDRLWREENAKLKKKLKLADNVAKKSMDGDLHELAEKFDNLFGLQPPNHLSSVDRLRISVDGAFLMREELLSLQRQHNSISLLLKQEERKVGEKEREIKKLGIRLSGDLHEDKSCEKCSSCEELHERLETEKKALKQDLKQYSAISGNSSHDMIGSAALCFARSKEFEIKKLERKLMELEKERNKWKTLHEQRIRPQGSDTFKNGLFKWRTVPVDLQRGYSVDLKAISNAAFSRKKILPPISQSSGIPLNFIPTKSKVPDFFEMRSGGFDTRPVPAEVKTKMNRVQDQLLKDKSLGKTEKDERHETFHYFVSGDPRDAEISSLKVRLVRSEKERAETATRATQERREAQTKLLQASRILEQAQNLTEQLKVPTLNMRTYDPLLDAPLILGCLLEPTTMDTLLAKVEKLNMDR